MRASSSSGSPGATSTRGRRTCGASCRTGRCRRSSSPSPSGTSSARCCDGRSVVRVALAAGALAWLSLAAPAHAFLVEVTTSVAVSDADDQGQLKRALQGAVDDVLKDAIAFTPTMVVVTRAMLVGERLYIRVLIADQDG